MLLKLLFKNEKYEPKKCFQMFFFSVAHKVSFWAFTDDIQNLTAHPGILAGLGVGPPTRGPLAPVLRNFELQT
jgi:hypothetical protein